MSFRYHGPIPSSKSLFNRALIVKSFSPNLNIIGSSESEDIDHLERSILNLVHGESYFDVGEGGTGLRFLLSRLSREIGQFKIYAQPRLLSRPHAELISILSQLGVKISVHQSNVQITSQGWIDPGHRLQMSLGTSSQFLSSILLSAWNLPFDLFINLDYESNSHLVTESYSGMTLSFLRSCGMQIELIDNQLKVFKHQTPQVQHYQVEPDWSSAATILIAAQIDGECSIEISSSKSLQPDSMIVPFIQSIGGDIQQKANRIISKRNGALIGREFNFQECPDLVPCMAVLCSFATGISYFTGLDKLPFKESNRLTNTMKLLTLAGVSCELSSSVLKIHGMGDHFTPKNFTFDPDQDHRMAMAAGLFKLRNKAIHILHPEVVNKSFKNFWTILNV
jgi:3-phosphoshikimate 1-carboxyvinyltransferase